MTRCDSVNLFANVLMSECLPAPVPVSQFLFVFREEESSVGAVIPNRGLNPLP